MFIGIDLGTSSVKMILIDHEQKLLATSKNSLSVQNSKDGYSEQDPQEWINAIESCFILLKNKCPKEFFSTISIGISGHMHGATLVDIHGKVIRPCILWNDTRSFKECEEFENQDYDVRSISGNIAMPGFTAPKINWIKNNEPENFKKIYKVLLPKDYLRFYLTGEYYTEMSDGSGTLWMDIKNRKWSEKLLSASFLSLDTMPLLVEGNEETGIIKKNLKNKYQFSNNVIIVGGAGDNAASALGMGIINEKQSFISLGTSGVFFTPTNNFLSNTNDAVHSFCHCLPNKWHLMSVMLSASNCLDWICSITGQTIDIVLKNVESFSLKSENIKNAPFFQPYLSGERTPHNDPHVRGSFHYLKTTSNQISLQYAVLEAICFGILDGINSIKVVNKNFENIFVVGGGSKSSFWINLLSSIIKQNLLVCNQSEFGASLGVARLAMFVDKNIVDQNLILKKIEVKEKFIPNNNITILLEKRYNIWKNIYLNNKKLNQQFLIL